MVRPIGLGISACLSLARRALVAEPGPVPRSMARNRSAGAVVSAWCHRGAVSCEAAGSLPGRADAQHPAM